MKLLTTLLLLTAITATAQKKRIDHHVYDSWKDIDASTLSDNGSWFAYRLFPQVGDGTVYFGNTKTGQRDSLSRATYPQFGPESNYLVSRIDPGYDTVRALKLKGTPYKKLPKDTLALILLNKDSTLLFPRFKSMALPDSGYWLAVLTDDKKPKPKKKRKKWCKKKQDIKTPKRSSKGKKLTLFSTQSLDQKSFYDVTDYVLSDDGARVAFITHVQTDTADTFALHVMPFSSMVHKVIHSSTEAIAKPTYSEQGSFLAFLSSSDTSKNKIFSLHLWDATKEGSPKKIVDSLSSFMPQGWAPSENGALSFSKDESMLFFGIAPFPYNAPKDTLLKSEKYELDIWHWNDPQLQPEQLLEMQRERKRTYLCVYKVEQDESLRLSDEAMEGISLSSEQTHTYAIGVSNTTYEHTYSWTYPWLTDVFVVNLSSGERFPIAQGIVNYSVISPHGKHVAYYSHADTSWYNYDIQKRSSRKISGQIPESIAQDNNGMPYKPWPQGFGGWSENDDAVLIDGELNVWEVSLDEGLTTTCLTCEENMDKQTHRYRHINWDWRKSDYNREQGNLIFHTYDKSTKREGFAQLKPGQKELEQLSEGDYKLRRYAKASEADTYLLQEMSFERFPDLRISDDLVTSSRVSMANPQQGDYNWGTVELVKWQSYKGIDVEGLLYKPEDFDSTKLYPMIVYFYERYDQLFHNHYVPKPTASIVYPTEYVSNGYIVFIPNVEYTAGHPGKSAYDCIVSGTEDLIKKHSWIDASRLGLQGQSWGGYQTAYLITQTNMYSAAMAGAPVSNMTSAYGGIRWGSGRSRMFQYERSQSRLGATMWDSLDLYIENSPVFFADQVKTPLLMMHNDNDGAVPWYQGIEYYMALRRSGKKVWLLNYNKEQHNLLRRPNKVDLSIRMRQFFDHYLMERPAPEWLKNGRPAVDKGRFSRYQPAE